MDQAVEDLLRQADAEIDEGDLQAASRSLRAALEEDPSDRAALINLAHVSYVLGNVDEATALLARAAEATPDDPEPLRNLVDMYRVAGRTEEARRAAEDLAGVAPDDVLALLDLADLRMACGDLDGAAEVYRRVRRLDPDAGHLTATYHGMIEVELRRERWRRALDLAIAATAADRHQLTTDLLAFVTAKLFGDADRPAPSRADLDRMLAEQRAEHRRAHAEALMAEGAAL